MAWEAVALCVVGAMETSPGGNTALSLCKVPPEGSTAARNLLLLGVNSYLPPAPEGSC